jgi:hypothetical protein
MQTRVLIETEKELLDEMFKQIDDTQPILSDLVKAEMVEKGFNPINKDDVQAFWMTKGIDSNG